MRQCFPVQNMGIFRWYSKYDLIPYYSIGGVYTTASRTKCNLVSPLGFRLINIGITNGMLESQCVKKDIFLEMWWNLIHYIIDNDDKIKEADGWWTALATIWPYCKQLKQKENTVWYRHSPMDQTETTDEILELINLANQIMTNWYFASNNFQHTSIWMHTFHFPGFLDIVMWWTPHRIEISNWFGIVLFVINVHDESTVIIY